MSEQEITRPDDDDVEAHAKSKKSLMANDEAPKDDETEDDVELHGSTRSKIK